MPGQVTIWPAETFYRNLMWDGALMDLSGNAFLDRIEEGVREVAKYGGKDYAFSVTMSAFGILVNNDLISMFPIMVFYFLMQKQIVGGLIAGAVKG